jgi:hypothetical protein
LRLLNEEYENKQVIILEEIYWHEYREVNEIWNRVPAEQWAMYEAQGIDTLREQRLLNYALKALKTIFKVYYGKKKKAGKEDSNEDFE